MERGGIQCGISILDTHAHTPHITTLFHHLSYGLLGQILGDLDIEKT